MVKERRNYAPGWRVRESTAARIKNRAELLGWSENQLVDAMLTEQMDRYGVPADPERNPHDGTDPASDR